MLFGSVVFLSAFLLFQVQLIVAKHLLPWFGGTPAVWTTSQMFFQVLLLGGYAYAHLLTQSRRTWLQGRIHATLLLGATVVVFAFAAWGGEPLLAPGTMKPRGSENPVPLLLLILLVSVGLPYFAVSTTAPLLQRWHSRQSASLGRTYRLYALSNAGSFLGLLSYPFGVERLLDLSQQAWTWATLFTLFAAGCGMIAWRSEQYAEQGGQGSPGAEEATRTDPFGHAGPARMAAWLLLTFTTSVLFLATTNQLTQDVATIPFLWVLPLAVYLLTFIVCFERPHWYSRRWIPVAAAAASLLVLPTAAGALTVPVQVIGYAVFLFCFCMLCHGELVHLRPSAAQLTLFYLLVALGGALGGTFVSIAAPALLPDFWEFHGAVLLGWVVVGFVWWSDRASPFHTGERWHLAALLAVVSVLAVRYAIERTVVGRVEGVSDHGWTVTLVGGAVLSAVLYAAVWRLQICRASYWARALVLFLVVMSGMFLVVRIDNTRDSALYAARNFYGVARVVGKGDPGKEALQLMHGTTTHGVQINVPGYRQSPTAYYSHSSGVALAARLVSSPEHRPDGRVGGVHFGIIGLGVGTMSAFARLNDRIRYYEINPEVIAIATGPFFTFISDSAAELTIVPGDARLSLERELAELGSLRFDLLVVDAFSSDSVPVHLVTLEAFQLYKAHLRDQHSILAVNVSNRYLDLEPVVAGNAELLGFYGARIDSPGDPPAPLGSSWIMLARDPDVLAGPTGRHLGGRLLGSRQVQFTDRYSNLFRVLK